MRALAVKAPRRDGHNRCNDNRLRQEFTRGAAVPVWM
jgi:hypothetical protein